MRVSSLVSPDHPLTDEYKIICLVTKMQSQPYVEVANVAVYDYASSKCARDAPSRAGGDYVIQPVKSIRIELHILNLNFIFCDV